MGGREKAGVVGYNGHFRAVIPHMIKDSILKIHKYVRILFVSRIKVSIMVLRLRSGAVNLLDDFSPFLSKAAGLDSTSITLEKD